MNGCKFYQQQYYSLSTIGKLIIFMNANRAIICILEIYINSLALFNYLQITIVSKSTMNVDLLPSYLSIYTTKYVP